MVGERAKDGLAHLLWRSPEDIDGHQVRVIDGEVAIYVVDVTQEGMLFGGVGQGLAASQPGRWPRRLGRSRMLPA